MATRRKSIIIGLAGLLGASLLAGCSAGAPIPFTSATPSPATESARAPSVSAAGPGTPLAERVGISAGSTILWDSDAVEQHKLQTVADSGAQWFEMDIDWNSIQDGGPTSYMWTATDRVVTDARARGLKILGMIGYSPDLGPPVELPGRLRQVPARQPRDLRRLRQGRRAALRRRPAPSPACATASRRTRSGTSRTTTRSSSPP